MTCIHPVGYSCDACKTNARVYTTTGSDGLPVIVVDVEETKEQIEARVRNEEFEYYMKLLKANNGVGAMTEAMWLLFDVDYYERGYSQNIHHWKHYLNRLENRMKYRKKPIEVEAIQYTGENGAEVCLFVGYADRNEKNQFVISTLEGPMFANPGDFIIKGIQGEFYPCKPDIFEQTYEPIKGETE